MTGVSSGPAVTVAFVSRPVGAVKLRPTTLAGIAGSIGLVTPQPSVAVEARN